ncbi:MAG: hypothetical protein WCN87_00665, partial [Chlamydiota bacterium]
TTQFWKQGNLTDKLKLLTDAAFKGVRFGESALQLAEKVSLILLFIGLSLPLACIGLITSTISSIKSLITTVGLEQKRAEFVKHIGATKGRPRIEQAISYCKRFESDIDLDNEKEKTRLLASGAQEKAIQPFLDARKKWALTGLFGSKSYPVIFQGFKKITAELDRIDQEIGALEAKPSTLGGAKHLQFMNARRDKIMGEASLWVDKFVSTLSIERTQSAASCISLMMMAAVTTISLAAFFVSIHYWLTTVVVLIVLASFIMMVNSFYNLWNQKEVSWQEKEQALDLLTAHFTEQMYKATEEDKVKLSNLFNFPIPEEISADKDLVTKEFEEHLKGILHQEKVERYINRTFVDAIQNQFKISGSKKGISSTELAKFEKDMTPFLKIIMQPQEKLLQKKLEDIAFRPTQDKSLEEKLSDAFFFYLEKLNADKPIPE